MFSCEGGQAAMVCAARFHTTHMVRCTWRGLRIKLSFSKAARNDVATASVISDGFMPSLPQ